MIIGIGIAVLIGIAFVASVALMIRDVRRLNRRAVLLTDAGGDAAGMSPAAMITMGSLGSH